MKKIDQSFPKERLIWVDSNVAENINHINNGWGWAGGPFIELSNCAIKYALYNWYTEQNLAAAKQWFYVAAKCFAISTTKSVGITQLWTCHDFMFPLLSDNPEIIALYATLSPQGKADKPSFAEKRIDPKEGEFQSYMVQTAISGDDAKLKELLEVFTTNGVKRSANYKSTSTKFQNAVVQFYSGLLAGNIAEMETALKFLGSYKSQNPTTENFLAFHAVVMCKLAWLRGYQVQVDSPLVPMEFMPVAPLAHYDDVYEFLKPDWVAPPPPSPEEQEKASRKRHEEAKKSNLELVKKLEAQTKPKSFFAKLFGK